MFRNFTSEQITENFITPDSIVNMDEVPLTFDMPLTRTINKKGESSVNLKTTGHEKTHFTVVLACTASGKKLPPMTIFKRKTMPKEKLPAGIVVKVNPKGWMDETMMKNWLNECYSKRPGGFFRRSKCLLVLDSMRAHIMDTVKQAIAGMNSIPAVIPGGTTKFLQPLDISVNRSFKTHLRAKWEKWMTEGDHSFTQTGRMKRASLYEVCTWILAAWEKVPESAIKNGFRKAEIVAPDNTTATTSAARDEDAAESDLESDDEVTASGDTTATTSAARADDAAECDLDSDDEVTAIGDTSAVSTEAVLSLFLSDTEESDFSGFSEEDE